MLSKVIVMEKEEFKSWYDKAAEENAEKNESDSTKMDNDERESAIDNESGLNDKGEEN